MRIFRFVRRMLLGIVIVSLVGPALVALSGKANLGGDWRSATRESAGTAPLPAAHPDALVHVYAARAFAWRGAFAVHTWIAYKPKDAAQWVTLQVTGWRQWRGLPVIAANNDLPDRFWYGQAPELIGSLTGPEAERAINELSDATARYPWPETYRLWPGPNSNTFVAWVSREVPALKVRMPVTAIGKDWLGHNRFVAPAPSNTGWQLSLAGVLGVTVAATEGLEINWLGTGAGIDFARPALKLPGIGRLGMAAQP